MIDKIKQFIKAIQVKSLLEDDNRRLRKQIRETEEAMEKLKNRIGDPVAVVEHVLGRGINWYDCTELESEEERSTYHKAAQDLLRNIVFKNEMPAIIADCVQYCAMESQNHDKTIGARLTINALELLRTRVEGINLIKGKIIHKKPSRLDDLYNKNFN